MKEKLKCALCDEETGSLLWFHDDENGNPYYICEKCRNNGETYSDYLYFLALLRLRKIVDKKSPPRSE